MIHLLKRDVPFMFRCRPIKSASFGAAEPENGFVGIYRNHVYVVLMTYTAVSEQPNSSCTPYHQTEEEETQHACSLGSSYSFRYVRRQGVELSTNLGLILTFGV
jgi:hypothetical protein